MVFKSMGPLFTLLETYLLYSLEESYVLERVSPEPYDHEVPHRQEIKHDKKADTSRPHALDGLKGNLRILPVEDILHQEVVVSHVIDNVPSLHLHHPHILDIVPLVPLELFFSVLVVEHTADQKERNQGHHHFVETDHDGEEEEEDQGVFVVIKREESVPVLK
jgi:hypothetical protein